jgi:hypothetical protein
LEDVARLVGSGWRTGVEGWLEQWVRFTCVLLGDESSRAAKELNEVLFIGGSRGKCLLHVLGGSLSDQWGHIYAGVGGYGGRILIEAGCILCSVCAL